jgi:rare lipoprotein A
MKRWIILTTLVIFASACGPIQDRPPRFGRNVHRIPDAVPKKESLSRIGNKPYSVFGQRYHPMTSAKGYSEVGIASWYGMKFHGRETSSGERYDVFAMTAAHKTLPLPTYVKVTNLTNNKSIIVKVNDRGPFHGDRIIDLSYAAAQKLHIDGTAEVKVEAIDPNHTHIAAHQAPKKPPSRMPSLTKYYVQLGAFASEANAHQLIADLGPATKASIQKKRGHFKVLVGPISSRHEAHEVSEALMSAGYKKAQIVTG